MKTIASVRKSLYSLPYEGMSVTLMINTYDRHDDRSHYASEDWHARVTLLDQEITVTHDCHDGPCWSGRLRKRIVAAIKQKEEKKRVPTSPNLLNTSPPKRDAWRC